MDDVRLVDPSLIPRARQLGIDRQKMLVMQAALFQAPEEAAVIQDISRPQPSRKTLLVPSAIGRKHSRDSDGEGMRADSRQRMSFGHDIEPAPFRPSRKYARVERSASVVAGHEGAIIDSGLSFGRSFRVGWGPGGTLAHLGSLSAPWGDSASTANSSLVTVSTVPLMTAIDKEAVDAIDNILQHHLSNSTIESDDDGVPQATPKPHLNFASLASIFPLTDKSFQPSLFRLGHALFDPIDLQLGQDTSSVIRIRVEALRRKIALSNWLQDAVSPAVEAEVEESLPRQQGWARAVFSLLTGNQVERACELAMDSSNVKLASLISQVGGDAEFRGDVLRQLDIWREQKVDAHVDENIRKIYALLAGIVDVLEGSKGTGLERCSDLSVGKGLDWKRAFGLHLWFGESLDATIADSLAAYEGFVNGASPHTTSPAPWYREGVPSPKSAWKLPAETAPPDALFCLIKLFANPDYLLSRVLAPFSFCSSPSDFQLPWHLYIILSRSLGVRDFSDRGDTSVDGQRADGAETEGDADVKNHSPSADLLANSYALQLEELGMLQHAAFVLMHLESSAGRKRAIQAMLARNAPKLNDWNSAGLIGSLRIPKIWVDEALATYELARGKVFKAYTLYLSARMYTVAHDLMIAELAPDAIVRKDLDLLKELLGQLSSHHIEGWHGRGKVLLDYTHAMTRLPELRARLDTLTAPSAAEAAEIEEMSRSVPKLMQQLPEVLNRHRDIRHEVALAEMISGLTERLDQLRPLALGQQLRTVKVPEATKLGHIRAAAFEKFLRSVEVA
ncbi:nuclear protein 96-domain-containing protein [Irpex rosettiformis]|uniref:Nuclear protein 96-domain-containing protein n=1 Tax=Irpex rosettiformis TaxID=378272 RepID=A0ACB8U7N0_9APHY|nr:nuclear protein 96-domain-containing protein [Irpex rosettiformis]